jgi:hypothetical protein
LLIAYLLLLCCRLVKVRFYFAALKYPCAL